MSEANQSVRLNARQKAELEELKKKKKTRIKYTIVGIVIVLLVAAVILVNSSVFSDGMPALKVNDTGYTVADVNYAYNSAYQTFYYNYNSYISYFLNPNVPLDQQECTLMGDGSTWKDYFMTQAEDNLRAVTAYYNAAVDAGYTLTDDMAAEIETAMTYYSYYATMNETTLNSVLASYFGNGVTEKVVRRNMERELISNAYLSDVHAGFTYSEAEEDAYYSEHASDFDKVNFRYCFISANADEENGITAEAAKESALATADAVLAAMPENTDEYFENAVAAVTGNTASSTSYSISAFMSSYACEEADIFENNVFTYESAYGVYVIIVDGVDHNDYNTVSMRHILVSAVDGDGDGTFSEEEIAAAGDKIHEIQAEWESGEMTEERFAELANTYSEDSGSNTEGGLYENIYRGQMVPEINDFLFADGRESGDTVIAFNNGSYTGYHIVYFVGEGAEYSRVLAGEEMLSNDYSAAVAALAEGYTSRHTGMWRYAGK